MRDEVFALGLEVSHGVVGHGMRTHALMCVSPLSGQAEARTSDDGVLETPHLHLTSVVATDLAAVSGLSRVSVGGVGGRDGRGRCRARRGPGGCARPRASCSRPAVDG